MATGALTGVVGLCGVLLGFGSASLLSISAVARARRAAARRISQKGAAEGRVDTSLLRLARNGVPVFVRLARLCCNVPFAEKYLSEASEWALQARGIVCTKESIGSLMLAVLTVLGIAASLVAQNPVAGLAADALVVMVVVTRVTAWREHELDELRESVPTALNIMGECFQSGYSLMQTMRQVAEQSEGRLSTLFARCADELQLGGTSREALECLRGEKGVSELSFVAVALDVQHQAGGSVAGVLSNAQRMVADEIELRRSMRVQTAQARLSAQVVSLMPFVLVAVLSVLSEGFLSAFFESVAGLVMLSVALVMQAAGVLLVRQMLKVAQ